MDLISQIVVTKDNMEVEEIESGLEELNRSMEDLKNKMEYEFNDLKEYRLRCIKLDNCIVSHSEEFACLKNSIDDLDKRVKNINMKGTSFIDSEIIMTMFEKLREMIDHLNHFRDIEKVDGYMRSFYKLYETHHLIAAQHITECKTIIERGLKQDVFQHFYSHVSKRCLFYTNILKTDLIRKWNSAISFTANKKGSKGLNTVTLNIVLNTDPSLCTLFQCLKILKYPVIELFCNNFLNDLLKPVLFHHCVINVSSTNGFVTLTSSHKSKQSKEPIDNIIHSLVTIFSVVNVHLNLTHEDGLGFVESVGNHCQEEFVTLLIQHHLSNIPDDNSQLILNKCQPLLTELLANNFMLKSNKLMNLWTSLKVNNILTENINTALEVIKKDLLDSVHVEPIEIVLSAEQNLFDAGDDLSSTHTTQQEQTINFNLLKKPEKKLLLPECQISKSAAELVKFLESILIKSINDPAEKITLCHSAHEIVYLYLTCPTLHVSSPRNAALIFNNSMYLAVQLILLDHNYQTGFPFCGFTSKLQNLALSELDKVVAAEQANLISSMQKSGLVESFEMEKFTESADGAIRACVKQLQLLQSVWMNILPSDVYNMAMGHLCSKFIEEIISSVILGKEINSNIKHSLQGLFTFVSDSVEDILKDEEAREKFVKNWAKWKELSLLFKMNLSTVIVRWDKAKGPLAHHFHPLQVRALVTALFPPSEQRERTLEII